MMKKIVLFVVCLLLFNVDSFADELKEKQLEYRACLLEINYCDQRIKVLQNEVKRLEKEIIALMKEKRDAEETTGKEPAEEVSKSKE